MPHPISQERPLILASGSRYRAKLLGRLHVPFETMPSGVNETPLPGEAPEALVLRLARAKAGQVAARQPERWVMGSDQVAACNGRVFGKPGSRERALQQLGQLSGQSVTFHTAVALVHHADGQSLTATDLTTVRFRALAPEEIARYVDAEDVLDCAGSFKSEGLGISLCASLDSRDPTGLIGLPLIGVRALLAQAGFAIP